MGLGARTGPRRPGSYLLAVRVRDAAGNTGPSHAAARRGRFAGNPGRDRSVPRGRASGAARRGPGALTSSTCSRRAGATAGACAGSARQRSASRGVSRSGALRVRARAGASGVALLALRPGSTPMRRRSRCRRGSGGACSSCSQRSRGRRSTGSRERRRLSGRAAARPAVVPVDAAVRRDGAAARASAISAALLYLRRERGCATTSPPISRSRATARRSLRRYRGCSSPAPSGSRRRR